MSKHQQLRGCNHENTTQILSLRFNKLQSDMNQLQHSYNRNMEDLEDRMAQHEKLLLSRIEKVEQDRSLMMIVNQQGSQKVDRVKHAQEVIQKTIQELKMQTQSNKMAIDVLEKKIISRRKRNTVAPLRDNLINIHL